MCPPRIRTTNHEPPETMTNNQDIVRGLLALLTSDAPAPATNNTPSPVAGQYCIIRCRDAGVHAGIVESHNGREAYVTGARRLWSWRVPKGAPSFLSGVATRGIDHQHSKLGTSVDVLLTETCEVIPCSRDAEESIRSAPEVERIR